MASYSEWRILPLLSIWIGRQTAQAVNSTIAVGVHGAEKCKRGTLLDLLTYIPLQNIKNREGGTLWGHKKFFEKSRTVPKKIQRGDPLGTSGFVGFLEKVNKK